jgi:lysozyme
MTIYDQLIKDEGIRYRPYCDKCSKPYPCNCSEPGNLTIGIGRNLQAVGVSRDEIMTMFRNDVKHAVNDLKRTLPFFLDLSTPRQDVLINMRFNMGLRKFLTFEKMIAALVIKDYIEASKQIIDSRFGRTHVNRSSRLAYIMEHDREPMT